ncbi:MAG: LpxL/LpxP family Kdo(2)-lipid IV(A) lauroyl/palmitoleoyl acyltransferase [Gammaproteobacteria bacterium]|nr:LpxL/LpxP family Kdo(2)-lipid IV(A) lauroyl/palmitoleoyl acyltransferase [Gammaproteobacteria bacterium]
MCPLNPKRKQKHLSVPSRPIDLRQFRSLRHWPTWIGIICMRAVAGLPFALQIWLGQLLGILSFYLAPSRRHVCEVNIALCFPELSATEQRKLVRRTFVSNGIGLIEICIAWCGNKERFRNRVRLHGMEHLEAALAEGRGVLLIGSHQTTFEIAGCLFSLFGELNCTYRRNDKNPLFDAFMFNGRRRLYQGVYERKDIRGAMRCLKQGKLLWYAPDQDYGAKHSVFAPFFGNLAATITAGSRFARFNNSPVLFFSHYRRSDNSGYEIHFSPVLDNYPSGDDAMDGKIINQLVENAICQQPDQYLWLHKRFKTPPPGSNRNPYQ